MAHDQLRLSRLKIAGPPTSRDTEASNAYAIMHDALGPVCICSLIGINSNDPLTPYLTTCCLKKGIFGSCVWGSEKHHYATNSTLYERSTASMKLYVPLFG